MAFCRLCGTRIEDGNDICPQCDQKSRPTGCLSQQSEPTVNSAIPNNPTSSFFQQGQPYSQLVQPLNANQILNSIPPEYRPLGAWAYFGYSLLFMIPIVGFILMIVFSFSNDNINRRNYARSYFCIYAVIGIAALLLGAAGFGAIFA